MPCVLLQMKLSSDANLLQVKNEPRTPTYDDDSISSLDAQPMKVCFSALCHNYLVSMFYITVEDY